MSTTATQKTGSNKHRPKATTVFAAAFLAGAAAAVGVNRAFDVHLAQSVPQVESEPIFVALRSLPKGSPVTIYDVALKEWPKAMLPATALRADAAFDDVVLRHPLQEGQPILSLQLAQASPEPASQIAMAAQVEPERVVQSASPQPAPAFVPYEAAAPIPVPAPVEQPQAAAKPSPTVELAAADPSPAAASMTPPPEPVAAAKPPQPESMATTESATADVVVTDTATTQPAATEPVAAVVAKTESAATEPKTAEPVGVATVEPAVAVAAAPTAAVAASMPTPAEPLAEPAVVEPAAEERAEPTLAATVSEPTTAAPSVEPVDVTAAVLAKAAASQDNAGSPQQPVEAAASPETQTVADTMLAANPAAQPAAANGVPTPAGQQVMRYLVVPERIALQVDHAFTRPQPPSTAKQQPPQPSRSQGVRPLPEASAAAGRSEGSPSSATPRRGADRSRQPAEELQAAAGSIPRATTRQPQRRTQQRTPAAPQQQAAASPDDAEQPMLRSLFPKLSAGLTAMGQEWRQFRDGTREPASNENEPVVSEKASSQQRSAARPQQSR